MALLTRFLKLSDHDDTQIFTFVGTKSVTRDLNRDITSKEFRYEILSVKKVRLFRRKFQVKIYMGNEGGLLFGIWPNLKSNV